MDDSRSQHSEIPACLAFPRNEIASLAHVSLSFKADYETRQERAGLRDDEVRNHETGDVARFSPRIPRRIFLDPKTLLRLDAAV